jgi:Cof subfamily protein (haloacid dehalogenase superfamily)
MPIKMLALDLDGTLAIENHQVLPDTRQALQSLHEEGVEVVIATGRRYRTTRFVIDNLGFDVYAVCNGGALVKTPEQKTHYESPYSTTQVNDLIDIARSKNLSLFGQRDSHVRGGADFIIDSPSVWSPIIKNYFNENVAWCDKGDMRNRDPEFLVTGTMGTEAELQNLVQEIHQTFPNTYNSIVIPDANPSACYCEITLANVTKWHGLSQLANLFGITAENICAVGDQVNDLPMLEAVMHGVAMGNGVEALHEHATFVCGNHDEDGILDVIDYIRRHNESITA